MKHLEIARTKDKEMYMFSLTRFYKDRSKYLAKGLYSITNQNLNTEEPEKEILINFDEVILRIIEKL